MKVFEKTLKKKLYEITIEIEKNDQIKKIIEMIINETITIVIIIRIIINEITIIIITMDQEQQ